MPAMYLDNILIDPSSRGRPCQASVLRTFSQAASTPTTSAQTAYIKIDRKMSVTGIGSVLAKWINLDIRVRKI